jgi:FtsP/CotA-like multicopper oxidase with cupredoxin domain
LAQPASVQVGEGAARAIAVYLHRGVLAVIAGLVPVLAMGLTVWARDDRGAVMQHDAAHCHIAEHMQSGMMFSFTVARTKPTA